MRILFVFTIFSFCAVFSNFLSLRKFAILKQMIETHIKGSKYWMVEEKIEYLENKQQRIKMYALLKDFEFCKREVNIRLNIINKLFVFYMLCFVTKFYHSYCKPNPYGKSNPKIKDTMCLTQTLKAETRSFIENIFMLNISSIFPLLEGQELRGYVYFTYI